MSIVLRAADLGAPLDPVRVFGREAPLVLEIGFGNGEFLAYLAGQHPDWNILGADTSPSSVVRARKRLLREMSRSVKLYCGDARHVVRSVVPSGGLHRVYVNFPDPWPRRRHERRRLLSPDFVTLLSSRLSEDGALWLTTDHRDYFAFARSSVAATGLFSEELGTPPEETLETRWARRWLEQNRPIYHALFYKTADPTDEPAGRLETTEMRHALMRGDLGKVTDFEKTVFKEGSVTIVLADAYRSIDGASLVFATMVEESDLNQHVLIEARPRGDDVLVGVTRFGKPLSTRGLNAAVRCVAEYLEGRGLEVLESSY